MTDYVTLILATVFIISLVGFVFYLKHYFNNFNWDECKKIKNPINQIKQY